VNSFSLRCSLLTGFVWTFFVVAASGAEEWPAFRGPNGSSLVPAGVLPVELSAATKQWSVSLPGRGLSGAVVVDGKVFVTASAGTSQDRLHLLCLNAQTGKLLWERRVWATGRTMCHSKTSVAAPTPCTDGSHIYALFSSNDVVCFDLQGRLCWLRGITHDYPNVSNSLGMASSPLVSGRTLVVPVENDSESYCLGIDTATGENRWRIDRPKGANWTSPVLAGSGVVALQSRGGVDGVQLADGAPLWSFSEGADTISSSCFFDGVLYVPSNGVTALEPARSARELWRSNRLAPGTASLVAAGDALYCINKADVLTAGERATGERRWQLRLQGPFSATPVCDGRHLWAVNEAGLVQVVELGTKEGKVVSTLDLGDEILASPAVADGAIYLRSNSRLHKLAR
jgi:outer membrane protein assembly factor BamB